MNTLKNSKAKAVGTAYTNLYTCPAATKSLIVAFRITNITASPITVNAQMKDFSDSDATVALIGLDTAIAANGYLNVLIEKERFVLEAQDSIEVKSSASASIDALIGATEFS